MVDRSRVCHACFILVHELTYQPIPHKPRQYDQAVALFGNEAHSKDSRAAALGRLQSEIRQGLHKEFPDAHPATLHMCSDKVLRRG